MPGLPLPQPVPNALPAPADCATKMASAGGADPDAEDAAETEEAIYEEVKPCNRMELSQQLAVEELITTEASYVHNIQLCVSDIRAHLQKKQVRWGTSPHPGAGDCGVNLSRAVRCPDHSREVTCAHLPPSWAPLISQGLELDGHWV